jgi:MFS family permease
MRGEADQNLRYNFTVNILDGGFFGMAMGFTSFSTVLPLFVSTMTSSAILIGLIPAIHAVGWQFPQLFMVRTSSRQKRYLPLVMKLTIHERLPYLGLVIVAGLMSSLGMRLALLLTFLMLIWQGLGGGFTAIPWQSLVAKIIPDRWRGTFFGTQAGISNLFAIGSGILAGVILDHLDMPRSFALCFMLNFGAMLVSMFYLGLTREGENPPPENVPAQGAVQVGLMDILRRNVNFRWFLVVRMLSQFATMGFAFYMVYAVWQFEMSKTAAGIMTGVMLAAQIAINPLMGWLGDRWSHRGVMGIGLASAALSAATAWLASSQDWFYLVVLLAGVANVAIWTIAMVMTLEFGNLAERQAYIGLSNTLIAPATILAPLFGGWLADYAGYLATFQVSAWCGVVAVLVIFLRLRDPRRASKTVGQ